jgi:hypothetical protein
MTTLSRSDRFRFPKENSKKGATAGHTGSRGTREVRPAANPAAIGCRAPIADLPALAAKRRGSTEAAIRLFYSMTSSARARIDGGIVRPSALAVFRFITKSNLVV